MSDNESRQVDKLLAIATLAGSTESARGEQLSAVGRAAYFASEEGEEFHVLVGMRDAARYCGDGDIVRAIELALDAWASRGVPP